MKLTISNPRVRAVLYTIMSVASIVLGSIKIFCGASEDYITPGWVDPAITALVYIAGGLGLVASANTPAGDEEGSTPAV